MLVPSHAVIAGTGRAGTSFLVDVLRRVGVPTSGLSDTAEHDRARAGLERPLTDVGETYLVKDPWLHEYLEKIDLESMTIDALIVPVRDLTSAAMSRVRLERAALLDRDPRLADWSSYGDTPGGLVYSLNVSDQERVLAVGQAKLIDWALRNEIPLHLLSYPRLVHDPHYLVDTLWPWLQRFTDREAALRIAAGMSAPRRWDSENEAVDELVARDQHLTLVAQKESLHLVLSEKDAELRRQQGTIVALEQRLDETTARVIALTEEIRSLQHDRSSAASIDDLTALLRSEMERREDDASALGEARAMCTTLRESLEAAARDIADKSAMIDLLAEADQSLRAEIAAIRRSRSHRLGRLLTVPWRHGVRRVVRSHR